MLVATDGNPTGDQPPLLPQSGAYPGLPIAEVSRLLGVPRSTLRSWELRYGVPTLERSFGAHRRYSPAELHTLRLMRDEIARGKRASLAAETVRQLVSIAGPAADYIGKILAASERSDPEAVQAHLSDASESLGLGPCLDEVMLPAMQQVGRWWQTGRCTIEDEHQTTAAVREWLESIGAATAEPTHSASVVLACGPTDSHTLGLEGLGLLLRKQGWSCRFLGPRIPVPDLVEALRTPGVGAVVVVSHLSSGRARAVDALQAADRRGVRVFYAGNAFTAPRSRRYLPGTYLGAGLQDACTLIEAGLTR
jgi:DNA-binding transcriptional MerR regulator